MRQSDLVYTISDEYYIEIRIRKCRNTFRLRLFNKNKERIDEIICEQKDYNKSMEKLINKVK
jgi:uncharacterized membrane protein